MSLSRLDLPPEPAAAGAPNAPRGDRRRALLLALVAFVVYNANLRGIATGDSIPARLVPLTVLRWGTVALDRVEAVARPKDFVAYWAIRDRAGRLVSAYPLATPLAVTPVFLPAVVYLELRGWDPERVDRVSLLGEKLAASLVAAVSVGLLFLALRRRAGPRTATLLAVAYGFGTNTWSTSSQALWQHGLGELLAAAALFLLTAPASRGRAVLLGLVLGLLPANRPPDVLLALGFAVAAPAWAGRSTPWVLFAATLAPALTVASNLALFGHPLGGYAAIGATRASFFDGSLLAGAAGLLFSPVAGLFVFAPFLLALPVAARRLHPGDRRLAAGLAAAALGQVLLYAATDWRGGFCYGPRFLTDLAPALVWLLAPGVEVFERPARRAFVAAVVVAVATQAVGAFCYPRGRSYRIEDAWSSRSFAVVVEARAGLAHPTFVDFARGLSGATMRRKGNST